jgi:CHAT domain-containing protein
MGDQLTQQAREALEYAELCWSRYRDHGDPRDLKAATGTYRRLLASDTVVASLPREAQAARANLALALIDVFALTRDTRYLDESIAQSATALAREDHDGGRLMLLNTRHVALLKRFAERGQLADLGDASAAVDQMERLAPASGATLINRGNVLMRQFDETGSTVTLDQAIDAFERCGRVAGDSDRASALGALADALAERFKLSGQRGDIDRAFLVQRQAIRTLPADSPAQRDQWLVLGNLLLAHYEASQDLAALDDAIDTYDRALPDHVAAAADVLQNVGYARILRFRRTHDARDLELGILACEQSMAGADAERQPSAGRVANLALGLAERWRLSRAPADLSAARERFAHTLALADATPAIALRAAINWGALESETDNWTAAHSAYQQGLAAAERLFEASVGRTSQETWLHEARGLGPRAAYAAARHGDLAAAVLSIERSRAVIFSRALKLATADVAAVAQLDPELAAQFRHAAARALRAPLDASAEAWGVLAEVIARIRSQPGFEDWLRRATRLDVASTLGSSAMVHLAAADAGGVALITTVRSGDTHIAAIWLPDLTDKEVRERLRGPDESSTLGGYLGDYLASINASDEEAPGAVDRWSATVDDVMQWCWKAAMGPLVAALPAQTHAVMVAAGALGFLPLHAAWTADVQRRSGRHYALDELDITYAPNALAWSSAARTLSTRSSADLLAVENPGTAAGVELPNAALEVQAAAREFPAVIILREDDATPAGVAQAMPHASVIHFCCHGRAEMSAPLASALDLANGDTLTLDDMLTLELSRTRLVVLSACETAIAGTTLPDEVVSLQSALLQAGTTAAVATAWAIYDTSAALVAARFYAEWRQRDGPPPYVALARAQRWVRDASNQDKRDWLVSDPRLVPFAGALLDELDALIADAGPATSSYADPIHWAAFTYAGA